MSGNQASSRISREPTSTFNHTLLPPSHSLVGHFDYKMLRFQAIDTPGILDHPLEEMNTIEHQSICAIAHLRASILYFMDLSEQCGYSVSAQIALFHSIKPLFANKLVFIVINKIDLMRPEDLDPSVQEQLQGMLKEGEVELLQLSCTTTEGVMQVRNAACDRLLAIRNAEKLKAGTNNAGEPTGRLGDLLRRIHVAQPMGGVVRETFIPEAAKNKMKYDKDDPNRPRLERDIEKKRAVQVSITSICARTTYSRTLTGRRIGYRRF